jgi:hypothetical protein
MKIQSIALTVIFFLCIQGYSGFCEAQGKKEDPKGRVGKAKELLGKVLESVAEDEDESAKPDSTSGYLDQLKGLAGMAKDSSGSTLDAVSKYIGETYNSATNMGENLSSSVEWAQKTYEALKANGMTTATTASQWMAEEMKKAKTWEYKVVSVAGSAGDMEFQLNSLGAEGWECFGTTEIAGAKAILCKRRPISMLSSIPVDRALIMMKMLKE